jgi:hypothetical protein
MYGVIRQYKVDPSAIDEIIHRANEGFVPLVGRAPGFVSYSLMDAGAEGLITLSTFEDQAGAEESVRMAASWIKDHLATLLPTPPQVTSGRFSIRNVRETGHFGTCVLRRYTFEPRHVEEITQRVNAGLVPLLSTAPGFAGYGVLDAGNGVVVSLSAFADRATADAAHAMALGWVHTNLAELVPNPPEVITAEVKARKAQAVAVTV